jgi:hypothetical protein
VLTQFPPVENASSVNALDLLGNGTACLVWSSALPGNVSRPMRYIDLMGGQKPHLLVQITNNLGAETLIQYTSSTKFYVADKLAQNPWVTRLPFPVHVVERMENIDYLSRTRLVTRYAYHHGFYDGVEREFRGFGMVEQFDSEGFEEGSVTAVHGFLATRAAVAFGSAGQPFSPPACIKTWFHTGAYLGKERISKYFEEDYYQL